MSWAFRRVTRREASTLSELRLREGLTWRDIDGELVAVDAVKSSYLSANAA
jgi:hypothetical protein